VKHALRADQDSRAAELLDTPPHATSVHSPTDGHHQFHSRSTSPSLRWLVRNGWAVAFGRYSTADIADEDYARQQGHGLWAGAFIAPWDWRHRGAHTIILGALAVATELQLMVHGGERGADNRPAPDAQILDDIEHQIVER
jgi:hypothetical protein